MDLDTQELNLRQHESKTTPRLRYQALHTGEWSVSSEFGDRDLMGRIPLKNLISRTQARFNI